MDYTESQIVQYRNAIYQGHILNGKRHGKGILITDSGYIIVGQWKNDLLFGKAFIQFNVQENGFGQFNRGQMEGYILIRKKQKSLFGQFNASRPLNEMILMDNQVHKAQVIRYKTPIYEINNEINTQGISQSQIIQKIKQIKYSCPQALEFLQKQFCLNDTQNCFTLNMLSNGNLLFMWNDQSNPASLGFVLGKSGSLVSYGTYQNNKLHGMGCKYQNNMRYQGMFANGFMNGLGLKYNKGKYSFGRFQEGNLVEAALLQERSNLSQQKLKQLKKIQHIKSINFCNGYVRPSILKFRGFMELTFEQQAIQQYLYPKAQQGRQQNAGNNNIGLKLLGKMGETDRDFETKSSKSFIINKNPEEEQFIDTKSVQNTSGIGVFKKFNIF